MQSSADSLRGSSDKIGTIQRRLAWPLRKDDTHKSRSVNIILRAGEKTETKISSVRKLNAQPTKKTNAHTQALKK